MEKIINISDLDTIIKKLKLEGKKIVLAGGCFDILHAGHLAFLKNAKDQGDILVVILESDESIRKIKGENRPIHPQETRARILESIDDVDYIIQIPQFTTDEEYAELVKKIEPDIIAVTKDDPIINIKTEHASNVNAKVVEVIERQEEHSTSNLVKGINQNFYKAKIMKKILLVYLVLIILVVMLAVMRGNFSFPVNPFKKSTVTINTKTFAVDLAKSEKEKMIGLSGRNSLDENSGMLFVFSKKDQYSFWMKDMKFPIDIIFIDTDKVVDVIQNAPVPSTKNAALLPIYKGGSPANYILEIKAGATQKYQIKIGDKVTIKQ